MKNIADITATPQQYTVGDTAWLATDFWELGSIGDEVKVVDAQFVSGMIYYQVFNPRTKKKFWVWGHELKNA